MEKINPPFSTASASEQALVRRLKKEGYSFEDSSIRVRGDTSPDFSIRMSLDILKQFVPVELNHAAFSELSDDKVETVIEDYTKINELLESGHKEAFDKLKEVLVTAGLLQPSDVQEPSDGKKPSEDEDNQPKRNEVIAALSNLDIESIEEPLRSQLQEAINLYSQYSWHLVLVNFRKIYSDTSKLIYAFSSFNTPISPEDVFQDALIAAYKLALRHDSNRGHFFSFLDNYLTRHTFLEGANQYSPQQKNIYSSYINPLLNAERRVQELSTSENIPVQKAQLLAFLEYRLTTARDTHLVDDTGTVVTKSVTAVDDELLTKLVNELEAIYNDGQIQDNSQLPNTPHIKFDTSVLKSTARKYIEKLTKFADILFTEELSENIMDTSDSPEDIVLQHEINEVLLSTIEEVAKNEREKEILYYRYGLRGYPESTFEEIAKIMGITRERVRNIINNLLRRMRHPVRGITQLAREYGGSFE